MNPWEKYQTSESKPWEKYSKPLQPNTAEQVSGPIVSAPKLVDRLTPTKEELPEFIGTMAGVFPKGNLASVAVGGVGAAVGEGVRQAITKEKLPTMKRVEKIGEAGLRGMGANVLGRVVDMARGLFGKKIPEATFNAFLQSSQAQAVSNIGKGAETMGAKAANLPLGEGMVGTRQVVLNKSKANIEALENKIQEAIRKAKSKNVNLSIDTLDVASGIDDLIKRYETTGVNQKEVRQLLKIQNDFVDKHGLKIPIDSANELKRVLHSIISDRAYLKGLEQNPIKVQAERELASQLRSKIADKIPDLVELNAKQGFLIGARDSLIQALAKESRTIPAAVIGEIAEPVFTGTARALRLGSRVADKLPLQSGGVGLSDLAAQRFSKRK